MSVKTDSTIWWCERCHASGVLDAMSQASVYEAFERLTAAHNEHELARLHGCPFQTASVRVKPVDA